MAISPHPTRTKKAASLGLILPTDTELVGLVFELTLRSVSYLYVQYAVGLHAGFWYQIHD